MVESKYDVFNLPILGADLWMWSLSLTTTTTTTKLKTVKESFFIVYTYCSLLYKYYIDDLITMHVRKMSVIASLFAILLIAPI